ncbi:helix-turn-helix transcriptional regulator [Chloroflexota bacterium]
MVEGHNGPEIASLLGISVNKVMDHKASIKKKLNVHNQTELIKYAIQKHLVSLES